MTMFCAVVHNICGSLVWNLLHVTPLACGILIWLLAVGRFVHYALTDEDLQHAFPANM